MIVYGSIILYLLLYLHRTQFKIPQGVNAFDYSERINLIGKLDSTFSLV